ncbi:MAG TPA: hypothetical protein DCS05_11400, partial [Nitrospiraceae bacterium]|nr:hypothetical protein [Nitrospiraceae bacterium]
MRKGIARFLEMRKRGKLVNGSIIKIFLEKGRSMCYFKGRLFIRLINSTRIRTLGRVFHLMRVRS